jgi:hypothetical protein
MRGSESGEGVIEYKFDPSALVGVGRFHRVSPLFPRLGLRGHVDLRHGDLVRDVSRANLGDRSGAVHHLAIRAGRAVGPVELKSLTRLHHDARLENLREGETRGGEKERKNRKKRRKESGGGTPAEATHFKLSSSSHEPEQGSASADLVRH